MDHQSEMCATSQEKFRPELRALRKLYGGDTRDARRKAAVLFCGCFVRLRLFRLRRLGLPELLRMKAPSRRLRKRRSPRGLRRHLDDCTAPLLAEPWILDMDTTVKPL